jgi:hypothetical protein
MTTTQANSDRALSASWLSTKLGVDTVRLNAMRRAGELIGVRRAESNDWFFPAWQFDAEGSITDDVRRVLDAARERRLSGEQLNQLLDRRSGMTGGASLLDDLLAGRVDHVLATLRSAAG